MTQTPRTPTPIDTIAEEWLDTYAELVPELRVYLGRAGQEGEYSDYSPAGSAALVEAGEKVLARIKDVAPADDIDAVTKLEVIRTIELETAKHAAGFPQRNLNVIASPAQEMRDIFDLMPTATETDWEHIAERMHNLPAAMNGYIESLRSGIAAGNVPAIRQVEENITQAAKQVLGDGFFFVFAAEASSSEGDLPEALQSQLEKNAKEAAGAYATLVEFLREELAPHAPKKDAVGREIYALASRDFLGAEIDLDETYEWGIEELARMTEDTP